MRSASQNTVDPQFGQKLKRTGFPDAEPQAKIFKAPSTTLAAPRSKRQQR
jgi:hypothetical protein